RVLEGTYNELTSRQSLLERALLESRSALEAINGLGEKPSSEVLIQIGGGAMLRVPPPATDKVLVNIGASVVTEKTKEEAVAILEARNKDVEKTVFSIMNQRNEIAERLEADRQILQTLLAQQGQKG
ncbi:MAG TPA: prefoldin subunit alpha, partial [Nitrososphaerales archaeon]|nr:prefoldin subunit alpha [Nitrososphaerales archaeon]